MKLNLLAFVLALVALPAAAQLPKAIEVAPGAMASADIDFMHTADSANIDQIMLSRRASSRAKIPGVRSLADNVAQSHAKAADQMPASAGNFRRRSPCSTGLRAQAFQVVHPAAR